VTTNSLVSLASFAGRTGRGVRIAVVDSGIHATHPHVGGISGGVAIDCDGQVGLDFDDRLGHGTAVAAAIREKAPEAALIAVRVFDRTLATTAGALSAAIEWSAAQDAALINLSLGTATPDHRAVLEHAIQLAARDGAIVVSAAPQGDTNWLPGALAGVIAVEADWTRARDLFDVRATDGRVVIRASGYPRPIPGVPVNRNFRGTSFAVANATGLVALAIEGRRVGSIDELARYLIEPRSAD
jgi:subtilisin family serine protease